MAVSCHACGAGLRDGARFCDACGSSVVTANAHAEYKQVTVLFADVVGSMDIAAKLGPERLREIMTELFNRSSAVVQRYGGTVDKFTGDGIMAEFGAPVALEDHALLACRAALDIQQDAQRLAAIIEDRDHIVLQLRIGLNSGVVITGEIGAGPLSYTAVGEQVGMAQRMESVAPPGGVMVGESTARLVENTAALSDAEVVHVKGMQAPVGARRLLGLAADRRTDRMPTTFVGREWEMNALTGLLGRALKGNGGVVGLVGPPGIGKSRLVRELTSRAADAGVQVATTLCESHTADVPFHAAANLLRSATGASGLEAAAAREQVRAAFTDADQEDLLLVEDLVGIGDPGAELPQIDADARRRRIASMINAAALARITPTMYVVEDAHWIDGISESMLADFLAVVPRTRSLVLVTYRPEYHGPLAHVPRSQNIALEPLDYSQMSQLSTELLGEDRSVTKLADLVAERAEGNPFFAEEIVRDLAERDVLVGSRGCYLCVEPMSEVTVPRTLQAVIAARIDRLDPAGKRTLNGAAVIGIQFGPEMLEALDIQPALDDLVKAELIDQTAFGPHPRYTFRHALIRAVAYESQLKSDRARLHKQLAATIERSDQNAVLIAEHLESAGELGGAYEWHMRAGAWSNNRDHAAAQLSWERARRVADALPPDFPNRLNLRISPRSLLCSSAFRRFHPDLSDRFEELRSLCLEAGDKASLAIGMAGLAMEHLIRGRIFEASQQASEQMALVESIGDPTLTLALAIPACVAKLQAAQAEDALRWAQAAIDLADGDSTAGSFMLGSPLALAYVFRGFARCTVGQTGWREDLDTAVTMARRADPTSLAVVTAYKYVNIGRRVVSFDDAALNEITEVYQLAERCSEDLPLVLLRMTLGVALTQGDAADRERGLTMLTELCDTCVREQYAMNITPALEVVLAVHGGDLDGAIERVRAALDELFNSGNFINCEGSTQNLVELLLQRGTEEDLAEAEAAIDKLAATVAGPKWVTRDLVVMRLRALLARTRDDESTYHELKHRYRSSADKLGFQGHMAMAAAMP
ncbi:adenylate/guanylate cyclase domain-containing protein [Mycolicibacterium sp. ND9-15]|uniref:AAA family ATPase n=1 Tax=Mycolicibacterium sp. ND9-15 TaxID=3042320 RepID=UPI002DD80D30|nr:adenylate/guanylate cyclase domain-containing protein [Mycolicibacterium sp. ND9-15]WSE54902.1 adenylate/guanylate cyclase domain-containing protein [Mycolicibacterium sp. ND9-15]